jgi:hypothetical protein
MTSSTKRVARFFIPFFSVILVLVVFAGVAEGLIRLINPVPPVQIVRPNSGSSIIDGPVPLWFVDTDRSNIGCAAASPQAKVVVFSGDSIFFGSGVESKDVFTALLQNKLDAEFGVGSWCVINLSQPAYSFEQKKEWLAQFARTNRIDHVYWEVWFAENVQYRLFNGTAYNFGPAAGAPGHIPEVPVIPLALSEMLFSHSRLYEYAFLTFLPRYDMTEKWMDQSYVPDLTKLSAWLREKGADLTLVPASRLDRPFAIASPDSSVKDRLFFRLSEFKAADVLFLSTALKAVGADFMQVRHDPCCHYNQQGHKILADIFRDVVIRDSARRDAAKTTR